MRKQPKLAAVDVFFLRWLRDNGGKCDLPGNTDLGAYYRVVNSGYVEVGLDRFSDAVRFTLTGTGRKAIEANGFQNVVAKPSQGAGAAGHARNNKFRLMELPARN